MKQVRSIVIIFFILLKKHFDVHVYFKKRRKIVNIEPITICNVFNLSCFSLSCYIWIAMTLMDRFYPKKIYWCKK